VFRDIALAEKRRRRANQIVRISDNIVWNSDNFRRESGQLDVADVVYAVTEACDDLLNRSSAIPMWSISR
jgi:hypothetical protein